MQNFSVSVCIQCFWFLATSCSDAHLLFLSLSSLPIPSFCPLHSSACFLSSAPSTSAAAPPPSFRGSFPSAPWSLSLAASFFLRTAAASQEHRKNGSLSLPARACHGLQSFRILLASSSLPNSYFCSPVVRALPPQLPNYSSLFSKRSINAKSS